MMRQKSVSQNILVYYCAIFLLTVAVTMPNAILTILLLDKGITISQMMLIQAGFCFAMLIARYPSSLLGVVLSSKNRFLLSKVILVGSFLLILYQNDFSMMLIAWFLFGVSCAMDQGTLDIQIINDLKIMQSTSRLKQFIQRTNQLRFGALIFGSLMGSVIYFKLGIGLYWVAIWYVIGSFLVVLMMYRQSLRFSTVSHKASYHPSGAKIKVIMLELKQSKQLKLMLALGFFTQFFFQIHFQLWQALLLEKGVDGRNFYWIYLLFQVLSLEAYRIPVNLRKLTSSWKQFAIYAVLIALVGSDLVAKQRSVFLLSYAGFVFLFTIFNYFGTYLVSQSIIQASLHCVTPMKDVVGRFGAMLTMIIAGITLQFTSILTVVLVSFAVAMVASLVIVFAVFRSDASIHQRDDVKEP